MNGRVVSAVEGKRKNYRPIESVLCDSANVCEVISGFLSLVEFNTIYIADLDSIEGTGLNTSLWSAVFTQFKTLQFWLDFGANAYCWEQSLGRCKNARPVLGSESYNNATDLMNTFKSLAKYRPLFSLDFKNNQLQGATDLFDTQQVLPKDIILLSLSRVGSATGPDIALCQSLREQLKNNQIYLGGGIRNADDLLTVRDLGVAGVLVANALHTGMIDDIEVRQFISRQS